MGRVAASATRVSGPAAAFRTPVTLVVPAGPQGAKTPEQVIEALVMEDTRIEDAIDMTTQYTRSFPQRRLT